MAVKFAINEINNEVKLSKANKISRARGWVGGRGAVCSVGKTCVCFLYSKLHETKSCDNLFQKNLLFFNTRQSESSLG